MDNKNIEELYAGFMTRRKNVARKINVLYKLQDVIFDLCPEEDIDIWLANGIPDGMRQWDAINFFLDMPKELTEIYNLAIRLLRGVEL